VNRSGTMTHPYGLAWPSALLVVFIVVAVLTPKAVIALGAGAALIVSGFRYPVRTVGAVLVAIPIIDQAVAEKEFADVFGAFRITPAVVLKATMILVIVSYLVRHRINPVRYKLLRPVIVWLGYTLSTCLLFHDRAMAVSMWMRLAYWGVYFIFFFVVAARETDESERGAYVRQRSAAGPCPDVLWVWRAGLIAAAIFAGSVFLAKFMGVTGGFYGVGESYGFYDDPWNMAMALPGLLVIALSYPWVSGDRRSGTKLLCGSLGFAIVAASYMTFTRTSLIACIVAALLFVYTLKRVLASRQTRIIFALTLAMVLGGVLFVMRNVTSTASDNQMSERWSEVDNGSVGSGRLEVFYAAWSKFANASPLRKLIGHGIGAGPEAAEEYTGVYVFLHDDLLEMLVCAGLIGVFMYCWLFGALYRAALAGLREKNVWAIAALSALAVYNLTAISYMRIYAVTPNTYFALVAGTSLGVLQRRALGQMVEQ
jgi:O-Antigen ligase